jgi:hypothetical protein
VFLPDPELALLQVISLKEEEEMLMEQEKFRKNDKGQGEKEKKM